jgi:hypothetical protein
MKSATHDPTFSIGAAMRLRFLLIPVLAFVAVLFDCCGLRAAATADPPPAAAPAKPLTEKDYLEFGKKLEEAVSTGDKETLDLLPRRRKERGIPCCACGRWTGVNVSSCG